jgi:hypothetical protein
MERSCKKGKTAMEERLPWLYIVHEIARRYKEVAFASTGVKSTTWSILRSNDVNLEANDGKLGK